jgi:hypothetical protein
MELKLKKNFIDYRYIEQTKLQNKYNIIVCIPVSYEYEYIQILIQSLYKLDKKYLHKTLFIFNINNTKSASDEVIDNNKKTYKLLSEQNFNFDVLLLKYFDKDKALDDKNGGVGLARKIAMDNALFLFDYSSEKNVLVCLDADCIVEPNYINEIYDFYKINNADVAYVNYKHRLDHNIDEIISYELYLRYYVLALHYANSPYAFHTIGSTITCTPQAYIKAEGMNKRKAAEDFYFLQKLAKNFKVHHIKNTTIYPSDRISHRVPFGTGKAIHNYIEGLQNKYKVYDFEIFKILKQFLEIFYNKTLSGEKYLKIFEKIHPEINVFLNEYKFIQSWDKILNNSKYPEKIQQQKSIWFDGFMTLKFVHHFDRILPKSDCFHNYKLLFENLKITFHNNYPNKIDEKIEFLNFVRDIEKVVKF